MVRLLNFYGTFRPFSEAQSVAVNPTQHHPVKNNKVIRLFIPLFTQCSTQTGNKSWVAFGLDFLDMLLRVLAVDLNSLLVQAKIVRALAKLSGGLGDRRGVLFAIGDHIASSLDGLLRDLTQDLLLSLQDLGLLDLRGEFVHPGLDCEAVDDGVVAAILVSKEESIGEEAQYEEQEDFSTRNVPNLPFKQFPAFLIDLLHCFHSPKYLLHYVNKLYYQALTSHPNIEALRDKWIQIHHSRNNLFVGSIQFSGRYLEWLLMRPERNRVKMYSSEWLSILVLQRSVLMVEGMTKKPQRQEFFVQMVQRRRFSWQTSISLIGYLRELYLQTAYCLKKGYLRLRLSLVISFSCSSFLKISRQFLNRQRLFSILMVLPVQGVKQRLSMQDFSWLKMRAWQLGQKISQLSKSVTSLTSYSLQRLKRYILVFILSYSFQKSEGMQLITFSLMISEVISELFPSRQEMKQQRIWNLSPILSERVVKQQTKMVSSQVLVTRRQDWAILKAPSLILIPYSFLISSSYSYFLSVVNFSDLRPKEQRHSTISFCVNPQVSSVIKIQLYFILILSSTFSQNWLASRNLLLEAIVQGLAESKYRNSMLMTVPLRFMLLSMSRPKAEKGCLRNLAIFDMVLTVKKVLWTDQCQNLMANCLLQPEYSLKPYISLHTLHSFAQRQSELISMTSIVLQKSRQFRPTPPIRQSRYWQKMASGEKPTDCSFRLLAVHSSVSKLKIHISLQVYASLSAITSPPMTTKQGDSKLTKIMLGQCFLSTGLSAVCVTLSSSRLILNCLASVNLISQILFSKFMLWLTGSKVSPRTKKPLPPFQKRQVLREQGMSMLMVTGFQVMDWQSRMWKSVKYCCPFVPPWMIRYLFEKKQEA